MFLIFIKKSIHITLVTDRRTDHKGWEGGGRGVWNMLVIQMFHIQMLHFNLWLYIFLCIWPFPFCQTVIYLDKKECSVLVNSALDFVVASKNSNDQSCPFVR